MHATKLISLVIWRHAYPIYFFSGPPWPGLYGSWIYNYLCNQCLSPLMLWVRISIRARCTTLCDNVCQWFATGWWFSPDVPVSFTTKTEILLKMALNTIKLTNKQTFIVFSSLGPKVHMNYCHHLASVVCRL